KKVLFRGQRASEYMPANTSMKKLAFTITTTAIMIPTLEDI
ncbi:hypothetical protein D1BOALGB6SA_8966, partial [Olavius sp. associated proteobacterium Delta 1]